MGCNRFVIANMAPPAEATPVHKSASLESHFETASGPLHQMRAAARSYGRRAPTVPAAGAHGRPIPDGRSAPRLPDQAGIWKPRWSLRAATQWPSAMSAATAHGWHTPEGGSTTQPSESAANSSTRLSAAV